MTMARRKASGRTGVTTGIVAILAGLALLAPAAAQAHTGSAQVACTGADFNFKLFAPGSNTVHYAVTVDGAVAASGDFTLNANGGREGALHVPLALTGNHLVTANAWWGPAGIVDGNTRSSYAPPMAKQPVSCPPPVTPPTPPAPPVTPPATPPAAPPVPPAATPPAPAGAVAGVTASSPASARASFASSCASRTARITINGRQMRSVTLSVNGHRIRTVRVAAGTRTLHVRVPIARGRAQIVSARVQFRNGARARTLTNRAIRCAAAQVQPQFTG
jgi:hypothetical protein